MAKARGESKTGLITTLVIFILATLGVGIYAYTLQADVTAKENDAKKAATEKGNIEKDRDWYRFQTLYYRSLGGHLDPKDAEELAVNWGKFDGGQLGTGAKDKDEVTRQIKETLNKRMPFDANAKRPQKTYEDLRREAQAQYETLEKRYLTADNARQGAEKKLKEAEDALTAATANYQAELKKVADQNQQDLSGFVKLTDDLRGQLRQIDDTMSKEKAKFADDMTKAKKEADKKDRDLGKLRTRLEDKEKEIAQIKLKSGDAPKDWRTDWKIVNMDRSGTQPYINLGSADRVTPQLTFNVHGVGPDGKPVAQSKGTVEVVNVISDHLSQVRVTSWKDRDKDPIVKGDVLFNPIWNPTLKKHVALAGTIELTGDGRDSMVEFIRSLEKQGIVVDAYLDLKEKPPAIKERPGISVQTDYLILGFGPSGEAREGDKQFQEDFKSRYEEMKKQARENGVTIVNLRQYLEMIGYRLPRALTEKYGATPARSILDLPSSGGDKKEADKDKVIDK
jgi:hypothetical protein